MLDAELRYSHAGGGTSTSQAEETIDGSHLGRSLYPDGPIAVEVLRVIGAAMAKVGVVGLGRLTLSRRERRAQGRMTVLGAAKVPFFNRDTLAAMLGLSPAQVDLIENDVGGGFGARGEFYPEDFLIVFVRVRVCVIGAIQSAQLNGSNQSTAAI